MAMLAEPRRKQKWSADPRNSTWSKDESKFGQKMLEKMGWSKGKGLGKMEHGATEHIKVKVKNNTLGLGTAASYEDNWIAHQDDFNQILADLNSCHGQNESADEQKESFSLEEKSKSSRKRVHYMKFTKGKDLSSRSETDLACVFGQRTKRPKEKEESTQEENETLDSKDVTPDLEGECGTITVTSSLSMQEYFAQRMTQLKNSSKETQNPLSVDKVSEDSMDSSKDRKRKSKKKRRREEATEKDCEDEDFIVATEAEKCDNQEKRPGSTGRKKKKKKKRREGCDGPAGDCARQDEAKLQDSRETRKRRPKQTEDGHVEKAEVQETGGADETGTKRKREEGVPQVAPSQDKSRKDKKGKKVRF